MVEEVLRYWLAMIRHEEALRLKIRAAPPVAPTADRAPNILDPAPGQSYFKLLCGGHGGAEGLLAGGDDALELPFAADRIGFFEHWLLKTYRMQRYRQSGEGQESPPVIAGFPVLFNQRRGELQTVLRLPLGGIMWIGADGRVWNAPTYRERKRRQVPPPPVELELLADENEEGDELPYALNEPVLSRSLGVQEETIGELVRELSDQREVSPADMIARVIELLDGTPPSGAGPLELITALTEAAAARIIEPGLRAWPMGIAYDAAAVQATHYLQRDLRDLIRDAPSEGGRKTAFSAYMKGEPPPVRRRVHFGHRGDRCLTEAQRDAAERFLGSRLTAVQGPPGTGKTELILSLCAQTLIERMSRATGGETPLLPLDPLILVASTNNQAVDNVIDPLSLQLDEDRLPLALRVGSRIVVESVTVPMLRRTADWLEAAAPSWPDYDRARRRLAAAVEAIRDEERPLKKARKTIAAVEAEERKRASLQAELVRALEADPEERIDPRKVATARRALEAARERLRSERQLLERFRDPHPQDIRFVFAQVRKPLRTRLRRALGKLGIAFEVPPPLGPEAAPEGWVAAFDDLADTLDEVENAIDDKAEQAAGDPDKLRQRLDKVEARLAELRAKLLDPGPLAEAVRREVAAREPGLFELALEVRERWAALNRTRLLGSVRKAIEKLESAPTLRWRARPRNKVLDELYTLFPVWGCTLLSLGNAFPMEPEVVPRVVIDEAGQCHPAYAVSAIYRAGRVMVIGDVNQLEPVIELNEGEEARVLRRLDLTRRLEALEPYRVHDRARTSAQTLAERAASEVPSLRDHFRCQPSIIEVSNRLCGYDFVVRTPPASLSDRCPLLRGPVLGIRTAGAQTSYIGSWKNPGEIGRVIDLLRLMLRSGIRPDQIAVLTPYRGQMRALEGAMRAARIPCDRPEWDGPLLRELDERPAEGVAVGTLHRFQGAERDVVVLSMVVSRPISLDFTNSRVNLVNVAVSRARLHLIVIGDPRVLGQGKVTGELIRAIPADGWLGLASGG